MDTAGVIAILIGVYLLTSAIKNRRPIELARRVLTNPAKASKLVKNAEGYTATSTGAPSFTVGGASPSSGTSTQSSDPTMALVAGKPTGSAAEIGLQPTAKNGLRVIAAAFPQLKSFGGRANRPISGSDHPLGLAVDFMIPKWDTTAGNALGWQVANYARANAKALAVKYIIFDGRKWNPQVNNEWRPYTHPLGNANPTLAHRDHVHVSFNK